MPTANAHPAPRIPFFKPGDLTSSDGRAVTFTAADLQEIVDNYDPALSRAPLVVGHPTMDAPAYGWAQSLSFDGELLSAEPDQVEVQFAAMVNDGRFPNRSAAIYLPNSPGNPKPGKLYLKHIGFLGAAAPAIPGLPPVKFAADADAPTFSFAQSDFNPLEPSMPESKTPDTNDAVTFAAKQAKLDDDARKLTERERELEAREKRLTDERKAAEREAAVTFAQGLVTEGKVLPAETDSVVELIMALPNDAAPVTFAQAGTTVSKPARSMLRELLTAMPKRVNYAEKSRARHDGAAPVTFAAPAGTDVDADRADLYGRVKEIQAQHPNMSFMEAAHLAGA